MVQSRPPLTDLVADYERHAARLPVSEHTVRSYVQAVRGYAEWLAGQTKHAYDEVVSDKTVSGHAAKDYRHFLLTEPDARGKKRAPKTVDAAMTGIGNMYLWLGLPKPPIASAAPKRRREPKSLDEDQLRDVLRAAESRGLRDHAITCLLYESGVRVSEMAALDIDDVPFSERRGLVIVRAGKGDKPREVPLEGPSPALRTLAQWRAERRDHYGLPDDQGPLWVTDRGTRMAVGSVRHVITRVSEASGVKLTPHTLRHTFGRNLIDAGKDIAVVADLLGHEDVNTTMGYVTARESHKRDAVKSLHIDY